jgi:membrane associated rhomboid family serine protease
MNFLDKSERVFGRFAIQHLMRYIVALNALVYLLLLSSPGYANLLELNRAAILNGEIWRLVTWIFLPNTSSPLWILFYLMFTWWVGETLESIWGTFRLNAYYFIGVLGCTLAAFLFGISGGNYLLVLSLLLAIATLAPDQEVLLLVFPVKLKWVAVISIIFPWGLLFVTGPLGVKAMILICLGNYLLFFGPQMLALFKSGKVLSKLPKPSRLSPSSSETLHRCEACGITEVSHPNADFRVAPDGKEYCKPHLPR